MFMTQGGASSCHKANPKHVIFSSYLRINIKSTVIHTFSAFPNIEKCQSNMTYINVLEILFDKLLEIYRLISDPK